jgi:Nuclear transport factor 2 (NTF2) domain
VQTFFVVAEAQRKYYVLNDMFRYLDEIYVTDGSTSDISDVADDITHAG